MSVSEDKRRSPEAFLARAADERKGKLKIYLGAAPGVGKTYEMLSDARRKIAEGVDIVAGVIETHGREETKALCEGLEVIPKRTLGYRGQALLEMDLDAILARKPAVALVDELAHTNVEGSRHPKRWMDVEEILAAGVDVWSTLNIQHLESLNDIVAQITRVRVRETVPDAVLEGADEIELIDLTPDELIERLQQGKVYAPDQAQRALRNYFAPGNLSALRELAMRRAADRIDGQVREHRQAQGEVGLWAAGARLLVCVDEREDAAEVVRHAKRLADNARAAWTAAHVKTARETRLSEAERARIAETLRLAARLGAETATILGERVAETLIDYAKEQNVSHIIVGKAKRPALFEAVFGSVVRTLIDKAETIAIYIVPENAEHAKKRRLGQIWSWPALAPLAPLESAALTGAATALAWPIDRYAGVSNLSLVFLSAVLVSALTRGLWAALLTAVFGVLAYNFFFTEPRLTFRVADPENAVSLVAFVFAAVIVSALASRARQQTLSARAEARSSSELAGLARGLASVAAEDEVAQTLAAYAARAFDAECAVFARVGVDGLRLAGAAPDGALVNDADMAAAQWSLTRGQVAGRGADTLPGGRWLFLPLRTSRLLSGVVAIARTTELAPAERRRLDAMADQAASALERSHIARAYEEARIETEGERLRATMLSSLSHDLKTPIAGILGAATSLRTYGDRHDKETRAELLAGIETETVRMQRYVEKLLDMTRLDAGGVKANEQSLEVADIVAAVLKRALPLADDAVWLQGDVEPGLPLLKADRALLEQALFNLVENAIVHGARPGEDRSSVVLKAFRLDDGVAFEVIDDGPGLPPGAAAKVFDKFYRGGAGNRTGAGLGLAIVKGFATLLGATVSAENRAQGTGAVFRLAFPADATA